MRRMMLVAAVLLCGCDYDECVDKCEQHFEECGKDDVECDLDSADDGDLFPSFGVCPNIVEDGVCRKLYNRVTKYHECIVYDGCSGNSDVEGSPCYADRQEISHILDYEGGIDCYEYD